MTHYIRLPLKGTANTRDLGGYPTKDGHVTKWQVFVRSDDLYELTESDKHLLKDYGLSTIIDLRSAPELQTRPNPYANDPLVDYHNVSLFENASPQVLSKAPADLLKSMYIEMLELHQDQVKAIFETIASAKEGMILFHCAAGKDRTGVIAMLLMGLVKVPNRDIVSNYEVSFTNLRRNTYFKQHENPNSQLLFSTNTNMEDTIRFVRDQYGSIENYLLTIGLSKETLALIKARFTE
jgi:protein-tyrosine phosphatase